MKNFLFFILLHLCGAISGLFLVEKAADLALLWAGVGFLFFIVFLMIKKQ